MDDVTAITNLLYRYGELIDSGDLVGATGLFAYARLKNTDGTLIDHKRLLENWLELIKIYPDGTPRTKHVITNPIVEINESGDKASCRSYYTVMQATDELPLQTIISGRYHDEFERIDGQWRFSYRNYSLVDMVGDLSGHLNSMPHVAKE